MLRMRSLLVRLRSRWAFRDELPRIPWDPLCQEDLLWWSWAIQKREGVDISLPVPDLSFYSDASDVGWGRHRQGNTKCQEFGLQAKGNSPSTSGRWWQCRKASSSSAHYSEARRSLSFATMSRQSLTSGDWEARGLRSCSSKRERFSCG